MAFGSQFTNQNSNIIIDGQFQNLSVVKSGSLTLSGAGTTAEIDYNGKSPVIAISVISEVLVTAESVYYGNGIYKYFFYSNIASGQSASVSFDYYIFDVGGVSSERYGMRIYNDTGAIVFDSGMRYLRVMGFGDTPVNAPSGKKYAYATCGNNYSTQTDYDDETGSSSIIVYNQGFSSSGGSIQTGYVLCSQTQYVYGQSSAFYYSSHTPIVSIDVTNY